MVGPSGEQYHLEAAGYAAVVTQSGAALRSLAHRSAQQDVALVDGFGADEMAYGGRGQLLMPWPNRIRDGAYEFDGRTHQLALSEPGAGNASHGLARWVAWSLDEQRPHAVTMRYRLMAQTGYPWTLDLSVEYHLDGDGLRVTQSAHNRGAQPAPYASGAHPFLRVGTGIDRLELRLPARSRALTDDRKLPVGDEPVAGTAYDFTSPRVIGSTAFDHAFTDLQREPDGTAHTVLRDPETGQGVCLWVDERHPWLQVFSADKVPSVGRRSLAVEPMTAPPDAFNSGRNLVVLAPDGEPGSQVSTRWGIRHLGFD